MRTAKTERRKQAYFREHPDRDHFSYWKERCVKEFTHWVIIKNDFPYDLLTTTHHLLIPKRTCADFEQMNKKEFAEFIKIRKEIANDYDCIMENFPRNRSVHTHVHFHLLEFKERYR